MTPIAISTLTADAAGAHLIYGGPQTTLGDYERRVTRTATLDGGVVTVDSGFSHYDRTVTIDLSNVEDATVEALRLLTEYHDRVILMLPDGAYLASPKRVTRSRSGATAVFYITGAGEVAA